MNYFQRVQHLTPTKFWINNPTKREADMAIEEGALGCTCNPAYCGKMLIHPEEKDHVIQNIKELVKTIDSDNAVEEELQRRLVKVIAEKFLPVFEQYPDENGHVSIQGDPIHEDDVNTIIQEARKNHSIAKNICCKIPTTESGLEAMETLIAENIAINATEVFAVQQAIDLCEKYEKICNSTGHNPKFYISHITGIYDEYFQEVVEKRDIGISPDILYQAGLVIARKLYQMYLDRGYAVTFVGGGARGTQHFTEMVGGDVCVTINWSGTADKLLEVDPTVIERLFTPTPQYVIDELMEKLPEFRIGYIAGEIQAEEYEDFGPVVKFRNSFIKHWNYTLETIEKIRREMK